MYGKRQGSAMIMTLVFMTLMSVIGVGVISSARLNLNGAIAAHAVEASYYTVESGTQVAIDVFVNAVRNEQIQFEIIKDYEIDYIDDGEPVVSESYINSQKAALISNIQSQFKNAIDTEMSTLLEEGINGMDLTVGDLVCTDIVVSHEGTVYAVPGNEGGEEEAVDRYYYFSRTYIDNPTGNPDNNPNFVFDVTAGGRTITVETNASTDIIGRRDIVLGEETTGDTENGKLIGYGTLPTGKTEDGEHEVSEAAMQELNDAINNLIDAWAEKSKSDFVQAPQPAAAYPATNAATRFTVASNASSSNALTNYTSSHREIVSARNVALTISSGSKYANLQHINITSTGTGSNLSISMALNNLAYVQSANGTVTLSGATYNNLEYITANGNVTLSGSFPKLKGVYTTKGNITITGSTSGQGTCPLLENISAKNNVTLTGYYPALLNVRAEDGKADVGSGKHPLLKYIDSKGNLTLCGDFPMIAGVYTSGTLTFGYETKSTQLPFTSEGKSTDPKPRMYGDSVLIRKFPGKTTTILNATVFAKKTLTLEADFDSSAISIFGYDGRNAGKFASNSVFLSPGSITIEASNSYWDTTYAPQFYTQGNFTLSRHMISDSTTTGAFLNEWLSRFSLPVLPGVFGSTKSDDSVRDKGNVSLQGYIINGTLPDGATMRPLNENQLGDLDSSLYAAMKDIPGVGTVAGEGGEIRTVILDEGSAGEFEVSVAGIVFRETTGRAEGQA